MTSSPPAPLRPEGLASAMSRALCHEVAGANRTAVRRGLNLVRRARLAAGDPPIAFALDGQDLLVPLSHQLPVHRAAHPDYSRNLGSVVAAVAALRPATTLVDIGANVGDSVAIVRARCEVPILCIEGDPVFLPYLHHNAAGVAGVEIVDHYVDTGIAGSGRTVIERTGGTARLVDSADGEVADTEPLADLLAHRATFARPGVLKIDTDGHDATILRSAADVLDVAHPVLFFEHDPAMAAAVGAPDPADVFAFLADHGYARFLRYGNLGPLLSIHTMDEVDELAELSRCLDPASDLPYVDICAIHGDDLELVEPILAAT